MASQEGLPPALVANNEGQGWLRHPKFLNQQSNNKLNKFKKHQN
jgi:hypothetical protein